jgi:hypothetical protein
MAAVGNTILSKDPRKCDYTCHPISHAVKYVTLETRTMACRPPEHHLRLDYADGAQTQKWGIQCQPA